MAPATRTPKRNAAPKQEGQPRQKIVRFRDTLRVELTPAQVAERADKLSHLIAERDDHEARVKAAIKAAKGELDEKDAKIRKLSGEVRDRAGYQLVDCERLYLYSAGRMEHIRMDTFEVFFSRNLTDDEMQQELFPDEELAGENAAATGEAAPAPEAS